MSRKTNDQWARELAEYVDSVAVSYGSEGLTHDVWTVQILGWERDVSIRGDAIRDLITRHYYQLTGDGIKPGILSQAIRNIEARARYGPRRGGAHPEGGAAA